MPQPPIYNRPPFHPETASQALTGQAASWMFPSLNMSYFNLQELRCDVNKMACIRGFYTGYACQNPMESFFILGAGWGVFLVFSQSLFSRDSDSAGTTTVPDTQHGLNNIIFTLYHDLATSWASTQRESVPVPPGLLTAPS